MMKNNKTCVAFLAFLPAIIVGSFTTPAFATANLQATASQRSIRLPSSTTISIVATSLQDGVGGSFANMLAVLGKYYSAVLSPQSVTFTYNVAVKGKTFWSGLVGDSVYINSKFQRVLTFYLDYSTYTIASKISLEDGRTIYCHSSSEVTSNLCSFNKAYVVSGSQLWGTQFPWTQTISREVYAQAQMSWASLRFWLINIGGGTSSALNSNSVTITVTK